MTKLILDTDIGTDVDDAWALALCLASEEIDLLGVTLVYADLDTRARIALKMLKLARRLDVPVYRGVSKPLTEGVNIVWGGHEGAETDFSDTSGLAAKEDAVEFILESARRNPNETVICPIGPLTNVAQAIRRDIETMRKAKRLVIMGTTYEGEGPENAAREHNAACDPVATKTVLESRIPATVVGLNVTQQVTVRREDMQALEGSGLGDYLAAMTCQYYDLLKRDFTYMHDPLAVATLIDPSVLTTRRMSAEVQEDGKVVYASDSEGWLDVGIEVDAGKFERLLISNVNSLVGKGDK